MRVRCDVAVIGLGHAGVEAALAAARLGRSVVAVTQSIERIGLMSCNPALGAPGKSQLVAEIDALGGAMGRAGDASAIHLRLLNRSKGPALQATRALVDRALYPMAIQALVRRERRLTVLEGEAEDLVAEGARIAGVRLAGGQEIEASAVVVTGGTFLAAVMHEGEVSRPGGRHGEPPASRLSASLRSLGFRLGRFRTGTPPRLDGRSIDYEECVEQPSEGDVRPFSARGDPDGFPGLAQRSCFWTRTDRATHALVEASLGRSPLFSGTCIARGPRYCPSLEHKIHFHPGQPHHLVSLEPDGLEPGSGPDVFYPAGLSTSLPAELQIELVRSIPGLRRVDLLRPGYAVEYDYVPGSQLDRGLGARAIGGLFLAGQINGSSGYEEAAAQGLVAGANAARYVGEGLEPWIPSPQTSYVGVLIRDLVAGGFEEPYRVLPVRAASRLTLRQDNAEARLWRDAREIGLVPRDRTERAEERERALDGARGRLSEEQRRELRRPGVRAGDVSSWRELAGLSEDVLETLLRDERYAPYEAQRLVAEARMERLAGEKIPADLPLESIVGLSAECRSALSFHRPRTLREAGALPGMTRSALAILAAHLRLRDRASAR